MPSPTPSHHHDRVLLLLVLLLLAAAVASRGDDDTYAVSACRSRPYLCGGVNISYPFYLASDDAKAVPDHDGESYCGYPGLAVSCDDANNKAVLKLGDDNYTVSGIDYANLIVSLADADAAGAGNGGCPVVDHNVTIPPAVRLSLILHSVDYLFFFVGCSFGTEAEPAPKPPKPPTIKPITCGDMDKPASMTFVLPRGEVPPGDWSSACRQVFEVPVLKSSVPSKAVAEDPVWRNDGYGKALRAGFQLGWDPSSGPCGQCEQSSGKCGYNRAGEFLGCLCADGGCSKISADSSALSWPGT